MRRRGARPDGGRLHPHPVRGGRGRELPGDGGRAAPVRQGDSGRLHPPGSGRKHAAVRRIRAALRRDGQERQHPHGTAEGRRQYRRNRLTRGLLHPGKKRRRRAHRGDAAPAGRGGDRLRRGIRVQRRAAHLRHRHRRGHVALRVRRRGAAHRHREGRRLRHALRLHGMRGQERTGRLHHRRGGA